MKEFLPQIIEIVGSIVGILIIVALNALKNYLVSKTNNEALKKAIFKADEVLITLMKARQQTIIDGLKKDAADGKITAEELKARMAAEKDAVIKDAIKFIGSEGTEALDGFYKDTKEYLEHRLESLVGEVKK